MKFLGSLRDLRKIGFIVPSSNTALEPITTFITGQIPHRVSLHFNRVAVRTLDTDDRSIAQFGTEKMLQSAALLNDSDLEAILWNGTSASWSGGGLQADIGLAEEITSATHLPCSTSTLAQVEVLKLRGVKRLSLTGPYVDGPMRGLVAFYEGLGYEVVKTSQMNEKDNVVFGNTPLARIRDLLREADHPNAECIVVACTNWPAALVLEEMEAELGKPIYDSVCVTLWKALRMVDVKVPLFGWGELLREDPTLAQMQNILADLMKTCTASRTTLRLDIPQKNCRVDTVCAEVCGPGIAQQVLIQGDLANTDVPPPKALTDVYSVKAQMLGPLIHDDFVYGWISVHQVGSTRKWSNEEVEALKSAVQMTHAILKADGWIE